MEAPEHVVELANACVVAVHNALKVELDFTQDTLPLLDHYVSQAKGRGEEVLGLVAPMCGAYYGEVVRRSLEGFRWHLDAQGEYARHRLEHERVFLYFNPVGVALEALLEQPAPGWGAHLGLRDRDRPAVEKAVDLFGDVREDDYFRFSVRYEVLEQALTALLAEVGPSETPIAPIVYADAIGDDDQRDLPN